MTGFSTHNLAHFHLCRGWKQALRVSFRPPSYRSVFMEGSSSFSFFSHRPPIKHATWTPLLVHKAIALRLSLISLQQILKLVTWNSIFHHLLTQFSSWEGGQPSPCEQPTGPGPPSSTQNVFRDVLDNWTKTRISAEIWGHIYEVAQILIR